MVPDVSRLLLGALLASLAWGAAWLVLAGGHAPAGPCADRCGPGTACVDDRCVPAPIEAAPPPVDAPAAKRRGKRRAGQPRAEDPAPEGDAPDADPPPPIVDDRSIPPYREGGAQTLDLNAGSERLGADVLDAQLRRLNPRFQGCVRDAVARGADLGSGTITIKVNLAPSGAVDGVSATAPAALQAPGLLPCVRKAVHDHRFPRFDGPPMSATFRFDVD